MNPGYPGHRRCLSVYGPHQDRDSIGGPPGYCGCNADGGHEDADAFVAASCHAAQIFEVAEHALDEISTALSALSIGDRVARIMDRRAVVPALARASMCVMPEITRRSSTRRAPRRPPGGCGWIASRFTSESQQDSHYLKIRTSFRIQGISPNQSPQE